jgi:uncharacterized protein (DUF2147 family)
MQEVVFNRRIKIIVAAMGFVLAAGAAMAQPGPQGWWMDQSGKAGILIAACGGDLCGRIEWLKAPLDSLGKPKTDVHNHSVSLQSRPVCGLQILGNFSPATAGGWKGGWIYDPDSGKTYKSVMHLALDGTLRVRGYVGIPLFGRSEVWTRPGAPLTPCAGG